MTPEHEREFRRRQLARAKVMALLLFGLVVLFFFITIARMS